MISDLPASLGPFHHACNPSVPWSAAKSFLLSLLLSIYCIEHQHKWESIYNSDSPTLPSSYLRYLEMSKATNQIEYGKRLLQHVLDEWARHNPKHVFAVVHKTSNLADGFREITIESFARAVNEVAHRIDSTVGRSTQFDTIAYLGPSQSSLQQIHKLHP